MPPVHGLWFSSSSVAAAEIAHGIGYRMAVLDIEHGSFDLAALERFIPLLKGLGFEVLAKVLAPERGPVQQPLDFGADAVVIPHVANLADAKRVCAYAKFPPRGDRSFAGGRTTGYRAPDEDWFGRQDRNTRCYPMIENAGALSDVEAILALDTVDGVFVGPSDLSLRRGRGAYRRGEGDWSDLKRVADAAHAARKAWILPAWAPEEQVFALRHGAHRLVLTMEHGALAFGLREAWAQTERLSSEVSTKGR